MADKQADKPKTVTVEALKYHTNAGAEYQVGDTYDVDEAAVDNLAHQGFAARVDRADVAKADRKAAEQSAKTRSTAVEPMGTTSKGSKALAKPRKARGKK